MQFAHDLLLTAHTGACGTAFHHAFHCVSTAFPWKNITVRSLPSYLDFLPFPDLPLPKCSVFP